MCETLKLMSTNSSPLFNTILILTNMNTLKILTHSFTCNILSMPVVTSLFLMIPVSAAYQKTTWQHLYFPINSLCKFQLLNLTQFVFWKLKVTAHTSPTATHFIIHS